MPQVEARGEPVEADAGLRGPRGPAEPDGPREERQPDAGRGHAGHTPGVGANFWRNFGKMLLVFGCIAPIFASKYAHLLTAFFKIYQII